MHRLYKPADDFEAVVRIFPASEGGDRVPKFNGIRWDFSYAINNPPGELYMIWPDFFSESGDSLPTDKPLPVGIELSARMFILSDEMRQAVHRSRIETGVEFFCHEGPHKLAVGRVTRITGLHTNPSAA